MMDQVGRLLVAYQQLQGMRPTLPDKPTHDAIREGLGEFFYKQTNRRPVVLPSIVRVPSGTEG